MSKQATSKTATTLQAGGKKAEEPKKAGFFGGSAANKAAGPKAEEQERVYKREMADVYDPKLVSPLMVYLASDHAKDMTGKTFLAGGGRIAEMKVVTAEGITKKEGGGLWTVDEIVASMNSGEILLPES